MGQRIANSVVVITEGSSGIGRATAVESARRRAKVVLAAHRETALHDAAAECERLGGLVLVVPTYLVDDKAVQTLVPTGPSLGSVTSTSGSTMPR